MTALAVVIIALMTAVCVLGTELSARLQNVMIFAQVVALLLFAVVALTKGGALDFSFSWLSPFALEDLSGAEAFVDEEAVQGHRSGGRLTPRRTAYAGHRSLLLRWSGGA